jgi:hypothetical protein
MKKLLIIQGIIVFIPLYTGAFAQNTLRFAAAADDSSSADSMLSVSLDTLQTPKVPDTCNEEIVAQVKNLQREIDSLQKEIRTANEKTKTFDTFLNLMRSEIKSVVTLINAQPAYLYDHLALGYEEGLAFRYRFGNYDTPHKKSWGMTGGAYYRLDQPTDQFHNPLHEFHVKLGMFRELGIFRQVRIAAYIEAMEKMKQFEAPPLVMETCFNRFSIWGTKGRAGMVISIYCVEHFMISCRVGVEYAYYTPPYIVNKNKTKLEKFGKGNHTLGISGTDMTALETIINNIGLYIFF